MNHVYTNLTEWQSHCRLRAADQPERNPVRTVSCSSQQRLRRAPASKFLPMHSVWQNCRTHYACRSQKRKRLFVTGDLDLVEYTRKSDGTKGMIPKITVYDWNYLPSGKAKDDSSQEDAAAQENTGFEELPCGENGLPYD